MGVESIDLNEVDCDSARRGFELLSLLNDLLPSRSNLRLRTTTSSIIHHLDWQSSENAVSRGIAPGGLGTFLRVARDTPKASYDLSKSQLILEHLPDYCFQTTHEILTMLEQANENSQDDTVKVVLSRMRKLGVLDSRTTEVKYGLWRYLMMEYRRES